MPRAVGDRSVLTPEIMAHYRSAQPSPAARAASAALPGYIAGASDWLRSIWQDRAAFADKPALILWGLKDIAFRRKELERWKSALQDVEIHEFEDCGHFSGGRGAGQGRGGGSELDGALVAPLLRRTNVRGGQPGEMCFAYRVRPATGIRGLKLKRHAGNYPLWRVRHAKAKEAAPCSGGGQYRRRQLPESKGRHCRAGHPC